MLLRGKNKTKSGRITVRYHFIKLVTGTDLSKRRIPVMMVDSGNPGPVIWMTACIHGDEIAGTVIIQELFRLLKKEIQYGKVHAFPIVNPFGFEQKTRFVPYSREDLNRLFPGNERGSLGERIAAIIYNTIIDEQPDLVLDLHNDWIRSIPYTLLDQDYEFSTNPDMVKRIRDYAFALGFPVVKDTEHLAGSLTGRLIQNGIPALTLELGASNYVNEMNIETGATAIFRLLQSIGLVKQSVDLSPQDFTQTGNKILKYSQMPLSSTSGIIRFYTGAGETVKSGQMIARIYNVFGKKQESLLALDDGLVLGCSDTSLSFPGFPVMAFGIEGK
jgi:predicted deacylase